jgi:hypothetical protein
MKRILLILLLVFSFLSGCTKDEPTRTSGIDTIDNIRYLSTTYYLYGFSFSQAKLISTNIAQGYDISVDINPGNAPPSLILQTNNRNPSFYKVGDFANSDEAILAFNNLKTITVTQWQDMADPVKANQVWVYRSGSENYTKIRIISTVNETRNSMAYGECTFQWVYQPDGSVTFP